MKRLSVTVSAILFWCITYGQTREADALCIKGVIEGFTSAFQQRKLSLVIDYWSKSPYISYADSEKISQHIRGQEAVCYTLTKYLCENPEKEGGNVVLQNFAVGINDAMAWAKYTESQSLGKDFKKIKYNSCLLEKVNGQWKIVAFVAKKEP